MATSKIADFFAQIGFKVNEKELTDGLAKARSQIQKIKDVTVKVGVDKKELEKAVTSSTKSDAKIKRVSPYSEVTATEQLKSLAQKARTSVKNIPITLESGSVTTVGNQLNKLKAIRSELSGNGKIDLPINESDIKIVKNIDKAVESLSLELSNLKAVASKTSISRELEKAERTLAVGTKGQVDKAVASLTKLKDELSKDSKIGLEDGLKRLDSKLEQLKAKSVEMKQPKRSVTNTVAIDKVTRPELDLSARVAKISERTSEAVRRLSTEPRQMIRQGKAKVEAELAKGLIDTRTAAQLRDSIDRQFTPSVSQFKRAVSTIERDLQRLVNDRQAVVSKISSLEGKSDAKTLAMKKRLLRQLSDIESQRTIILKQQTMLRDQLEARSSEKARAAARTRFQSFKDQVVSTRNLITSFAVPLAAGLGLKQISDASRQLQGMMLALETASGSTLQARDDFRFLSEEASRLGVSLGSVGPAFAKLSASGKSAGFTGDQIRETFTAVTEASVALQLSADDTEGAIRAIVQMMSKGSVASEELNISRLAA